MRILETAPLPKKYLSQRFGKDTESFGMYGYDAGRFASGI